jgi:hypothetical protein
MEKDTKPAAATFKVDLVQLKKERLHDYVPFITQMIKKLAGSELESQWTKMYERVTDEKK